MEILALGPLTNLALAIRLEPTFPLMVRNLVTMVGAINGEGGLWQPCMRGSQYPISADSKQLTIILGNVPGRPSVEFNAAWDPEAAAVVLQEMPFHLMVRHRPLVECLYGCGAPGSSRTASSIVNATTGNSGNLEHVP